jgi:hypothetical protein
MAAQGAAEHGVELHAFLTEVLAQTDTLSVSEFAQIVVISRSKRSLPVSYQI